MRERSRWLKGLKVPDEFSSNISKCVNTKDGKILGMKTHDCHVFLERLFSIAIRDMLPRHVCDVLIELSIFCKDLCSKELRLDEVERLEQQIVLTMCKLEKIFSPAFFDIMEHLPVHLPWELRVGGPIQYRWMYPIERLQKIINCHLLFFLK